jgi:hypothetical protein
VAQYRALVSNSCGKGRKGASKSGKGHKAS